MHKSTKYIYDSKLLFLSAVFFLGPFLKKQIFFKLSSLEQERFNIFVKIGTLALVLLCISSFFFGLEYVFSYKNIISIGVLYGLILLEIYGICAIFIPLEVSELHYSNKEKKQLLVSYIPGYINYLRYRHVDYQKPIWRYKESMLFWFMIAIGFIISSALGGMMLYFLIIRVILLLMGIDIIPTILKIRLNTLYIINVEEILSILIACLFYPFAYKKGFKNIQLSLKTSLSQRYDLFTFGALKSIGIVSILIAIGFWGLGHRVGFEIFLFLWGLHLLSNIIIAGKVNSLVPKLN